MATIVALMGIPAAGKSTLSKQMTNLHRVSVDDYRERLTGDRGNQTRNQEAFRLAHEELREQLSAGVDVLFDSTMLTDYARQQVLDIVAETHSTSRLIIVRTPFEECKARNLARTKGRVPDHVMDIMMFRFGKSLSEIGYEPWDEIINHFGDWKPW